MALTRKDAVHTALAAFIVSIYLAVTRAWGWPMLGGSRMGVLAVGVVSIVMCSLAGPEWAGEDFSMSNSSALVWMASILGFVALALVIAGMIVSSETILLALTVDVVVLWALSTLRHAFAIPAHRERRPTGTSGPAHSHAYHA